MFHALRYLALSSKQPTTDWLERLQSWCYITVKLQLATTERDTTTVVVLWSSSTKQTNLISLFILHLWAQLEQVLSSSEDKTASLVALRTVKCLTDRTSCIVLGGWVSKITKQNKWLSHSSDKFSTKISVELCSSQITNNGFLQNHFIRILILHKKIFFKFNVTHIKYFLLWYENNIQYSVSGNLGWFSKFLVYGVNLWFEVCHFRSVVIFTFFKLMLCF